MATGVPAANGPGEDADRNSGTGTTATGCPVPEDGYRKSGGRVPEFLANATGIPVAAKLGNLGHMAL